MTNQSIMDTEHTPLVYFLEISSHLINIITVLYAFYFFRYDLMLANINSAVSSALYHACALGWIMNDKMFARIRESDYCGVIVFVFIIALTLFKAIPRYFPPENIQEMKTVPIEEYTKLFRAYENANMVRWLYLLLMGLFFWAGWIGFDTKLYGIVVLPTLLFIAFLQYMYLRSPISLRGKYVLFSSMLTLVVSLVIFYVAGNPGDRYYGKLHPVWHAGIDLSYLQFLIWIQIENEEPWIPEIGILSDIWFLLTKEKINSGKKQN
jgi:hypothetical protein